MYKGYGYHGSPTRMKSKANEEIVPNPPAGHTTKYEFYKFQFNNDEDCSVTINKKDTIFIPAGPGFITGPDDAPITSFVIKEAGITYNWAAAY